MNKTPRHHKLFWGSSYDRGIQNLLLMWPEILKNFPDATLDICYGWNLFITAYRNNPERMSWMETVDRLMKQPGITHHGRVGKDKLKEIRSKCGVWAYPSSFTEIFCITSIESQNNGLVPVTMTLAALSDTAKEGVLIDKDINTKEGQEEYLKKLLELMGNKKEWRKFSKKCVGFAKDFSWNNQATKWLDIFNQKKAKKELK